MTDPANLDELEALRKDATPGEWGLDGIAISQRGAYNVDVCLMGEPSRHAFARPSMLQNSENNAALIVAAVNTLPTLISELRAARVEIERLRAGLSAIERTALTHRRFLRIGLRISQDGVAEVLDEISEAAKAALNKDTPNE